LEFDYTTGDPLMSLKTVLTFLIGALLGRIGERAAADGATLDQDANASAALDVLLSRLQGMQADWDSLDNKLLGIAGVSVATTGIFIGALASGGQPRLWEWLGLLMVGALTLAVGSIATWQYWPREMHHAPKLEEINVHIEHKRAIRSWVNAVG